MKTDLEMLEKFCEGRMNPAEKAAFEKALQEDASLSNDVRNYYLSKVAIAQASNERLKKRLDELGESMGQEYKSRTRVFTYLMAAAGIILFAGIGWVLINYFRPGPSADQIFLSYYERPDVNEFSERSDGGDSAMVIWNRALVDFSNHQIRKASRGLEKLTTNQVAVPLSRVYFMLAVCHMESGEFDRAITALNQVRAENEFTVAIDYYKALCHIKTGNTTEATALLEKIRNHRNHPYSKNAKRMLRILK